MAVIIIFFQTAINSVSFKPAITHIRRCWCYELKPVSGALVCEYVLQEDGDVLYQNETSFVFNLAYKSLQH